MQASVHGWTVTCSPSPGYPGLRQNRSFHEGSRWQTVSRALRSRQGVEVQSSRSSQAAEGARFTDLLSLFFADDSILVSSSADLGGSQLEKAGFWVSDEFLPQVEESTCLRVGNRWGRLIPPAHACPHLRPVNNASV